MSDPALKTSLSSDQVESYIGSHRVFISGRSVDGLRSLSTPERLILIIGGFIVSTLLYVHLDVVPFLPFSPDSQSAYFLIAPSFLIMVFTGFVILLWLLIFGYFSLLGFWYRFFPPEPKVFCPDCGSINPLRGYLNDGLCPKCQSYRVYCGDCGQPTSIHRFLANFGCVHCDKTLIKVKW